MEQKPNNSFFYLGYDHDVGKTRPTKLRVSAESGDSDLEHGSPRGRGIRYQINKSYQYYRRTFSIELYNNWNAHYAVWPERGC